MTAPSSSGVRSCGTAIAALFLFLTHFQTQTAYALLLEMLRGINLHLQKLISKNGNAYHYTEIKIFNGMEIIRRCLSE
jgi:hypothetical protein